MISERARKTAAKYVGHVADTYDSKREGALKRERERQVLQAWLAEETDKPVVLDCPVGTGFLFPYFRAGGFTVIGMDSSREMIAKAERKIAHGDAIALCEGSAFDIRYGDGFFDVTLCIRLLNLVEATDMQQILGELQRVTKRRIIFNLRTWHPATKYRNPQRLSDVVDVLKSGWAIGRNVALHEDDFRMIELVRVP